MKGMPIQTGNFRSFRLGENFLDMVFIANEIVNEKSRMGEGVVFKIDLENAYDHVGLGFLDLAFERNGFGVE